MRHLWLEERDMIMMTIISASVIRPERWYIRFCRCGDFRVRDGIAIALKTFQNLAEFTGQPHQIFSKS